MDRWMSAERIVVPLCLGLVLPPELAEGPRTPRVVTREAVSPRAAYASHGPVLIIRNNNGKRETWEQCLKEEKKKEREKKKMKKKQIPEPHSGMCLRRSLLLMRSDVHCTSAARVCPPRIALPTSFPFATPGVPVLKDQDKSTYPLFPPFPTPLKKYPHKSKTAARGREAPWHSRFSLPPGTAVIPPGSGSSENERPDGTEGCLVGRTGVRTPALGLSQCKRRNKASKEKGGKKCVGENNK